MRGASYAILSMLDIPSFDLDILLFIKASWVKKNLILRKY